MLCESCWERPSCTERQGLNPCSNGRCSASDFHKEVKISEVVVLILVLMEDALRELNLRRVEYQLVTVLFFEKSA